MKASVALWTGINSYGNGMFHFALSLCPVCFEDRHLICWCSCLCYLYE